MNVRTLLIPAALGCLLMSGIARAQATPTYDEMLEELVTESPSAANNNIGPRGIIPNRRGFNLSVSTASQHDSAGGWSNTLTPTLAYRFNKHFSADASTPIFFYILTTVVGGTVAKPTYKTSVSSNVPGDTALAAHAEFLLGLGVTYTFTPTVGFPSGNGDLGLGGAQTTYDFNNHIETDLPLSPFVELGIGDSTGLVNRRVRKGQQSTGTISHFEFGGSVDLPLTSTFSASVYEVLPIGDQNIYSTTTVRKVTTTKIVGTSGLAEDNGFNTSLDIPLQSHITLSGTYNRSLRQHNDTVGFAFTFFARAKVKEDKTNSSK